MESEKLIRMEENQKNILKRVDNLENKIQDICDITISIKELTMEIKEMREDANDIEKRVDVLEEMPKKKWYNMVNQIISMLVAGTVGYFLSKIGMH